MSNRTQGRLAFLKRLGSGLVAGMLVLGIGGALSPWAWSPPTPAQRHVVEVRGFEFIPAQLKVAPGDTVVWVNRDVVPHTVTQHDGRWDSGTLQETESWHLVVQEASRYSYYCRFHPTMKGALVVR